MTASPRKKKKNGRIRKHRVAIVLGMIFVVVMLVLLRLVFVGVFLSDDFLSDSTNLTGDEAIVAIEQTLGAQLSDSVENPHYYYTAWLDYYMRIRVDMSPNEMETFLDGISITCLQNSLEADVMPFRTIEGDADWWRPYDATTYSGMRQCGDNTYWSMMVDQSSDAMWRLYVESFST